jgi:hypothetical protein
MMLFCCFCSATCTALQVKQSVAPLHRCGRARALRLN